MKKFIDIFKILPWFILGGTIILISLPIMVITKPFFWMNHKLFLHRYNKYLVELEGKNLFCYNNKSKSLEFIENNLLPKLPNSIEIIFLNGRYPYSNFSKTYISYMLYDLNKYCGFPHLIKIRQGECIEESINNELFNIIEQDKGVDKLVQKINEFFNLTTTNNKNAA